MNEGYQSILETQGKNVYNQRDSFISFYFKYCPNLFRKSEISKYNVFLIKFDIRMQWVSIAIDTNDFKAKK